MLQMDGTRFLLQALSLLKNSGAAFYGNSTIQLSFYSISCHPPEYLGPPAQVQKQNPKAFKEAKSFFEKLQPSNNVWTRYLRKLQFEYDIIWKGEFFYLFNEALWKLNLVSPRLENEKMTVVVWSQFLSYSWSAHSSVRYTLMRPLLAWREEKVFIDKTMIPPESCRNWIESSIINRTYIASVLSKTSIISVNNHKTKR